MNDTFLDARTRQSPPVRVARHRMAGIILVGTALVLAASFFSPGARQRQNMRIAQRHAELIMPQVHADQRFRYVHLKSYTGMGGSLMVSGTVETGVDRDALSALVLSTKPPVKTGFLVGISPQAEIKPR